MLNESQNDAGQTDTEDIQNGDSPVRKTLQQRLTDLIDCNIKLENKTNMANKAIDILRQEHENEIKKIKCFYETEMCEARRLLNQQAEDCARLSMRLIDTNKDHEQSTALNEEYKEQVSILKEDRERFILLNQSLEIRLDKDNRTNNALTIEVDKWRDDANIYQEKNKNMSLSLEKEIVARISAENKVQGLEEQITINEQIFQDIIAIRQSPTTDTNTPDAAIKLTSITDEYAALYEDQLSVFETESTQIKDRFENDLRGVEAQLREVKEQLSKKAASCDVLSKQIVELETAHKERETALLKSEESALIEVEKLKSTNQSLEDDYKEVLEKVKEVERVNESNSEIEIKKELNTFESLLQCEEARLGLTPARRNKRKISECNDELKTTDKKKCKIM